MDQSLKAIRTPRAQEMRIDVTGQQQQLKEKHAGGPDRRCASKPGQYPFANNQLHEEQQECRNENGQAMHHARPVHVPELSGRGNPNVLPGNRWGS